MTGKLRPHPTRICENPRCRSPFVVLPHNLGQRFCCRSCVQVARLYGIVGQYAAKPSKQIAKQCENPSCGKEFFVAPSETKRRFCCKSCVVRRMPGDPGLLGDT